MKNKNIVEQLLSTETFEIAKANGFEILKCQCGGYPTCICTELDMIPTQSLLQKWLREKHMIYIFIERFYDLEVLYYKVFIEDSKGKCSKSLKSKNNPSHSPFAFSKYEEALEKGLQEALKLIK